MRVLEFLEMLILVFLIPFAIFVVFPFGFVWAIGRVLQLLTGAGS